MRKPNPQQASLVGDFVAAEPHGRGGNGVYFAGNMPEMRGARNLGLT